MPRTQLILLLLVGLMAPTTSLANGPELFARVDDAMNAGRLDPVAAAVLRLELVLDPASVDAELRPARLVPVRCATPQVAEAQRLLPEMNATQRERVTQLLARPGSSGSNKMVFTHLSPSGNFLLHYELEGNNRVSDVDVDPANGVPDYVEQIASYLDNSWAAEFDAMGYTPPPLVPGPYEVYFQFMFSYGFTQLADSRTEIVLHYSFEGFDPNDDPDGDAEGSAKVTCAHELKHASQHATSGWVEGNWLEVDATWIEEIVYPQVNDYHQYLVAQGALDDPTSPLDEGGTGSYGDCIWQHYLSERFGNFVISQLWIRRALFPGETMLDSYDNVLVQNGSSLPLAWPRYALWNFLTGTRSTPGLSYLEAGGYPNAPLTAVTSSYPFQWSSAVERLAAEYIQCSAFPAVTGTVDIAFQREPGSDLRLFSVVRRRDGQTVVTEHDDMDNLALSLSTPLDQLGTVGFVVANGDYSPAAVSYTLDVSASPQPPAPLLALGASDIEAYLATGSVAQAQIELRNDGNATSVIDYQVHLLESLPPAKRQKSVMGSEIVPDTMSYGAGDTLLLTLSLDNNSPDGEWMSAASLTAPAGVTVLSSADFVASSGTLQSDRTVGEAATVRWFDVDGGYGEIRNGQSATAQMSLAFDAELWGDLDFAWSLEGDQWDQEPHSVAGMFTLSGPDVEQLRWEAPVDGAYLKIGDPITLQWSSFGSAAPSLVDIDISRDGGQLWTPLWMDTPNDGNENWIVQAPASDDVRFRVRSADSSLVDAGGLGAVIYQGTSWLDSTPSQGSLGPGQAQQLMLSVDGTQLAPGNHEAWVAVVDPTRGLEAVIPFSAVVSSTTPTSGPHPPTRLHAAVPNPFNPRTKIAFDLEREGHVRLRIFDARGALVATLVDAQYPSGSHSVLWRGSNDAGETVASGVYRALLEASGSRSVQTLTLVR